MGKIKENQDKAIELIKNTMCNVEGEEYFVQKVDVVSPWYHVFGDNHYTGGLFVIANKDFMESLGKRTDHKDGDVTWKYQGSAKVFDISKNAVIIQYNKGRDKDGGYDFKKVINSSSVAEQYPYLLDVLGKLKNVGEDENYIKELSDEIMLEIESISSANSRRR